MPGTRKPRQAKTPPSCEEETKVESNGAEKTATSEEKPKDKGRKQPKCAAKTKPPISPTQTETDKSDTATNKPSEPLTPDLAVVHKANGARVKTASSRPGVGGEKTDVDKVLLSTLDKLKIKSVERSWASRVINDIKKTVVDRLKSHSGFESVECLPTGSYYENLKIRNPDEFDLMLVIPLDRVDIEPFGKHGAYFKVSLKRGACHLKRYVNDKDTLLASVMLDDFREQVKHCVKTFKNVKLERKKPGCPAVTLQIGEDCLVPISLDLVLGIEVRTSWPYLTKDGFKIDSWLGKKTKKAYKDKPYYLVPKYEGKGEEEQDGIAAKDAWRISFSHVEKDILKNHGSERTCCESGQTRCCRKDCLKLLKHLLSLLKEQKTLYSKFFSYHAKTTLFHACCLRSKDTDWDYSNLTQCFLLLLKDFEGHLNAGKLENFFIPTQNLLSKMSEKSCKSLAQKIKEEREKGFPIFLK